MLTLSSPREVATLPSAPEGFSVYPCWSCQCAVLVPEDSPQTPECSACQRMHAESAMYAALRDVQELIEGTGVFAVLPMEERREQLAAFGVTTEPHRNAADAPTPEERDELESRIELEPFDRGEWTMR